MDYYNTTVASVEMFLFSHGIKLINFLTTSPDTAIVLTDKTIPDLVKEQLLYIVPIGVTLTLKTLESHVCICFGPPMKDCPMHIN